MGEELLSKKHRSPAPGESHGKESVFLQFSFKFVMIITMPLNHHLKIKLHFIIQLKCQFGFAGIKSFFPIFIVSY